MATRTDAPGVSVESFAHGLADRHLACRDNGHVWVQWHIEVIHADGGRRRIGGFVRTFKCRQCRSERRQVLDGRGAAVSNGYRYADGYLAQNVQRGFGREQFRLESIARWLEKHPDAANAQDQKVDG